MEAEVLANRAVDGAFSMLRLAPLFMNSAMTPMSRMPQMAKVTMMMALSFFVVTGIPSNTNWQETDLVIWALTAASELLFGMMLLFGFLAAQAAVLTLGRVLEMQIGFGAAGIIDPSTSQNQSLIGTLFTLTAILLMFALQIDHSMIASLWMSFTVNPIGSLLYPNALDVMVPALTGQFFLALLLVLPVLLSLLCLDMVIGFLAKTMPQMNIYFVSLPLKIAVGLIVFWLVSPSMLETFKRIFQSIEDYWLQFVGV